MTTFKITLAYDGTGFVGWQRQANGISIQALIEDALRELDGRDVTVTGAGRTDAGVHACGQVAAFTIARELGPDAVVRALNAHLPHAIRVITAEAAPAGFHPRFGARAKTYRYRMWNDEVMSPFDRAYAWHVPGPLDVAAMAAAARLLEGRHDFVAFQATGSSVATTEREVFASSVVRTARRMSATRQPRTPGSCATRSPAQASSDTWCGSSWDRWSRSGAAGSRSSGLATRSPRATVPPPDRRRRRTDCFWCESTTAARLRQGPKSLYTRGLLTKEP